MCNLRFILNNIIYSTKFFKYICMRLHIDGALIKFITSVALVSKVAPGPLVFCSLWLGNGKHTTHQIKIISHHKPWEILYIKNVLVKKKQFFTKLSLANTFVVPVLFFGQTTLSNTVMENPMQRSREDIVRGVLHFLETDTIL